MLAVLTPNRRRARRIRRCGAAETFGVLLTIMLAAAATSALADAAPGEPAGEAARLDRLAGTIGDLKASLRAIREDLAAMDGPVPAPSEPACAAPVAASGRSAQELEELRASAAAERSAWQHAEAAMTGELTGLRGRLAAAEASVEELHEDREALVKRIRELDALVQKAYTGEVVEALVAVEQPPLAERRLGAGLLRVTQPALAAEAPPALKAAASPPMARTTSRLDLQAELALAQLRIAELGSALDSARLREESMAAEVTTLRSLTDAQIRRFMAGE